MPNDCATSPLLATDNAAFIPGLAPWGLGRVPGYRADALGVEDPTWRAEWFTWRDAVAAARLDIHHAMDAHPHLRAAELELCRRDPAYWLSVYGWIDEPRPKEGESYFKPFTPYAAQVDLLQWFVAIASSPRPADGYVSKSRGFGATRIFCAGAAWGWLFQPGWRGLLVSRKEDLVDRPQDLNSMFGYIEFLLDHLPPWMMPEGFAPQLHRHKMLLRNPETKGLITGEATTKKAGRGGRATYILYDEAAFILDFLDVYATGAGTSNHRFAISSESPEHGFTWTEMWQAVKKVNPDAVKELDWFHSPYFDQHWHDEEEARWRQSGDPDGFLREYHRDPWAGWGNIVYPLANRLPESSLAYVPGLPLLVGIDPGRADDTAIVFAQFEGSGTERKLRWVDSYEKNLMPGEWYAHILTGLPPEPGDACFGLYTPTNSRHYRDTEIMEWLRTVPANQLQVACDPAGGRRELASGISFVERVMISSLQFRERQYARDLEAMIAEQVKAGIAESAAREHALLTVPRPKAVVPLFEDIFKKNKHEDRRLALRPLLAQSVFANTPGAARIRQALENYRFAEPTTNTTTQPAPIHDKWSHLVTACEYLAVYIALNMMGYLPREEPEETDITRRARWAA